MGSTDATFFSQKLKEFYWTVTRAVGLGFLHDPRVAHAYFTKLLHRAFHPLYVVAAWFLRRSSIRFVDAPGVGVVEHIGHCACDFDCYLKDQRLSGRKVRPVFLLGRRKPANEALIAHLSKYVVFVRSGAVCDLLQPLLSFPELVDLLTPYNQPQGGMVRTYAVQSEWADRKPLLSLSDDEIARGEARLQTLGIPKGAWFVCVHSREAGYLPGHNEVVHTFRNTSILDYVPAMQAITGRGGFCVRVGDATMRPLPPMPGVVDYALSPQKSAWMDIFLFAKCRFFLGGSSGPYNVTGAFGHPSALANMTPLGTAYSPFPRDISIPKLLMDASGKRMTFPEIFQDEASDYRISARFEARGLQNIDNTPDEIAELAVEMMDILDGRIADEPGDAELQSRFRALPQPHHYAYYATSRIGRAFLRCHRDLL